MKNYITLLFLSVSMYVGAQISLERDFYDEMTEKYQWLDAQNTDAMTPEMLEFWQRHHQLKSLKHGSFDTIITRWLYNSTMMMRQKQFTNRTLRNENEAFFEDTPIVTYAKPIIALESIFILLFGFLSITFGYLSRHIDQKYSARRSYKILVSSLMVYLFCGMFSSINLYGCWFGLFVFTLVYFVYAINHTHSFDVGIGIIFGWSLGLLMTNHDAWPGLLTVGGVFAVVYILLRLHAKIRKKATLILD